MKAFKRTSILIKQSPYSKHLHNNSSYKQKRLCEYSPKAANESCMSQEKAVFRNTNHKKTMKTWDFTEISHSLDKAKHFTSSLAYLLSNRTAKSTTFQIYSEIYLQVSEYFPEFKDLFAILRRGLVISAIKEKDFEEFEFKKDIEKYQSELPGILEKERKENQKLVKKLNALANENLKIKDDYDKMHQKYLEYEQIIYSDPNRFIEAEKLFEKMMEQCNIIHKQQNYIQELKISDLKLKKILEYLEAKGMCIESLLNSDVHSVINPSLTKVFRRSLTLGTLNKSNISVNN